MKTINELLDEAKKLAGIESDTALAKALSNSQQVLSNWRNGKGQPDLYAIWQLSEITGRDTREIMAIIEAEREKRPEIKALFEKVLEAGTYKKVAIVALGTALLSSPFGAGDDANAAKNAARSMYIMSSNVRRWLAKLASMRRRLFATS